MLLVGFGFSAWRKYRIDCSSGYAAVNIVHTTFTSGRHVRCLPLDDLRFFVGWHSPRSRRLLQRRRRDLDH